MEVKHTVKELRDAVFLTQTMLAQKLGVSARAVSQWENGIKPKNVSLLKIAKFFKTEPSAIDFSKSVLL